MPSKRYSGGPQWIKIVDLPGGHINIIEIHANTIGERKTLLTTRP